MESLFLIKQVLTLLVNEGIYSLSTKKDIPSPPKNIYWSLTNKQYHKEFGGFGPKVLPHGGDMALVWMSATNLFEHVAERWCIFLWCGSSVLRLLALVVRLLCFEHVCCIFDCTATSLVWLWFWVASALNICLAVWLLCFGVAVKWGYLFLGL